jgi:YHS domain-containing protein
MKTRLQFGLRTALTMLTLTAVGIYLLNQYYFASEVGLDGYCPVSLSDQTTWVKGDKRFNSTCDGTTYWFVGQTELNSFIADPDRYAPVASGIDVVLAKDQGKDVFGQRRHGLYYGNRVYLFASEQSLSKFESSPAGYVTFAKGMSPGPIVRVRRVEVPTSLVFAAVFVAGWIANNASRRLMTWISGRRSSQKVERSQLNDAARSIGTPTLTAYSAIEP